MASKLDNVIENVFSKSKATQDELLEFITAMSDAAKKANRVAEFVVSQHQYISSAAWYEMLADITSVQADAFDTYMRRIGQGKHATA